MSRLSQCRSTRWPRSRRRACWRRPTGVWMYVNAALARDAELRDPGRMPRQPVRLQQPAFHRARTVRSVRSRALRRQGRVRDYGVICCSANDRRLWSAHRRHARDRRGGDCHRHRRHRRRRHGATARAGSDRAGNFQGVRSLAVISQALNETHNLDDILRMIVDAARQIIPKAERRHPSRR